MASQKTTGKTVENVESKSVPQVVVELALNKIVSGENVSRYFKESEDDFSEFKASIKKVGMLQPVVVEKGEGGKYKLVAGNRRLKAAKELGWDSVPVHVVALPEGISAASANLRENLQRKNMTPAEVALAAKTLFELKKFKLPKPGTKDGGDGTKVVAKEMGVSPAYVTQHLKLLDLSDKHLKLLHEGTLSAQAGFKLADMPQSVRDVVLEEAEKEQAVREEKKAQAQSKVKAKANKSKPSTEVARAQKQVAAAAKKEKQKRIEAGAVKAGAEKAVKAGKIKGEDAAKVVKAAAKGGRTLDDFTNGIVAAIDGENEGCEKFAAAYQEWVRGVMSSADLATVMVDLFADAEVKEE